VLNQHDVLLDWDAALAVAGPGQRRVTGLAAPLSPSATSSTPVVRRCSGRASSGSCCGWLTVGRSTGGNRWSTVPVASTDSSLGVRMPGVWAVAGSTTGRACCVLFGSRRHGPPSSDHLQSRHRGEGHVHPRLPAGAVVAALPLGRHAAPVGVHRRGVRSLTATFPRYGLRATLSSLAGVLVVPSVVAANRCQAGLINPLSPHLSGWRLFRSWREPGPRPGTPRPPLRRRASADASTWCPAPGPRSTPGPTGPRR
jgi:hypothetical protein